MASPYAWPEVSDFTRHQREYLGLKPLAFDQGLYPHQELEYYPAQTPTPTLMNPMGQRRVVSGPQPLVVSSPLPAPVVRIPAQSKESDLVSPTSRRATLPSLQKVVQTEFPSHFSTPSRLADADKRPGLVPVLNEFPIGSLVHCRGPPNWGVIKISNIPYSVTKQEIVQFVGRQARLVALDKGCPIHIIMERPTAKTMDCYAEFETPAAAKEVVDRINKVYETGRAPRLGNRHVEVEISNQDELLKDLFPRAKCVIWNEGIPEVQVNTDPYSTGFCGFFTSEEIIGAIRHAEIPHRSPFCAKCPQRTYESTISTLYKFPWYATKLYTVEDRNQLFELTNRHILSLVSRIQKGNTIGLDQRLLRNLLHAGLECPAFNDRQKYTLCVNSEDMSEIVSFPDFGKWFPFDTLISLPNADRQILHYYSDLISKGVVPEGIPLANQFPMDNKELISPFGRVWFEWPAGDGKLVWDKAVQVEMSILRHLVRTGWEYHHATAVSAASTGEIDAQAFSNLVISPPKTNRTRTRAESTPQIDAFGTRSRRPTVSSKYSSPTIASDGSPWNQKVLCYPPPRAQNGGLGHRNTLSSPNCFPPEKV